MAVDDEIGVLDTSTFIWLDRIPDAHAILPAEIAITTITLAELSVGPLTTDDPDQRAVRQRHLQQAENVPILAFDDRSARAYGAIAATLRAAGSTRKARAFDALIAATAVAHGLPLYTGNPSDFAGIPGLDMRAVPAPDSNR